MTHLLRTLLVLLAMQFNMAMAADKAPCGQIRVGYPDQERRPFFLGSGTEVPAVPGAAVQLIQSSFSSLHCTVQFVRMPEGRLRVALASNQIDFAPIALDDLGIGNTRLPSLPNGKLDLKRALKLDIVVYVRAQPDLQLNVDPASYLNRKIIGANLGTPLTLILSERGFSVDQGAANIERNLEKLKAKRIDGVAVVAIGDTTSLDALVAQGSAGGIVRLHKPLATAYYTLGASPARFESDPHLVHAVWDDIGQHWQRQLRSLVSTKK